MSQVIQKVILVAFVAFFNQYAGAQVIGYWPHPVFDPSYQDVSLIQLIANPEAWDGKKVRLTGFLRLEFEGDAVYLHREDYEYSIMRNALWINLPRDMVPNQRGAVNMHYVLCEAVFDAGRHGHMGLFSGALSQVSRIQLWIDHGRPDEPPPPPPATPKR